MHAVYYTIIIMHACIIVATAFIVHCSDTMHAWMQGFGSHVLKKSGWREGEGVGVSNQGRPTPVEVQGQHPAVKNGLGLVYNYSKTYNVAI